VERTDASVRRLISKIEHGEIRLPEMQRPYVWRSSRVRDLFDSLYRGYPSGAILLWDTKSGTVPLRDFAVKQEQNVFSSTQLRLAWLPPNDHLQCWTRPVPMSGFTRTIYMMLLCICN